jgi:hypothetical protein
LADDHASPQMDLLSPDVESPEPKPTKPTTWHGPYRTPRPTQPKRCFGCRGRLSARLRRMGAWWCEHCKDPDGYLPRLEKASAEARDRCRMAYPPVDPEQLSLY